MHRDTWAQLVEELADRQLGGYYWTPAPQFSSSITTTFLGLPILIKNFLPYPEVIVGV